MVVNITIPNPTLTAGQYFGVRYRIQGTPTWTAIANQTNAAFSLNLTPGIYEFEFTLIQSLSPLSVCTPVIKVFTVVDDGGEPDEFCVSDVSGTIVAAGAGYNLEIAYTAPVTPQCGWNIEYGPVGGPQNSVVYGITLPPSPIVLPASNVPYQVVFYVQLCSGLLHPCFVGEIPAGDFPCTPAVLSSVVPGYTPGTFQPFVKFTFVQSSPMTNFFLITYLQTNPLIVGGGPPDAGGPLSVSVMPGQTQIIIPINPNPNHAPNSLNEYSGTFVDGCSVSTPWSVQFD